MIRVDPLGDRALQVTLGDATDQATGGRVAAAARRLARLPGLVECVPGFTSLTLHYDPLRAQPEALAGAVAAALAGLGPEEGGPGRTIEIPVRYGGESGPDLEELAARRGLSPDEVVRLHAAGEYRVQMLGFIPGFPYLAGLDPRLHAPRRDRPRLAVPAGSVGIGGAQTGVYPLVSPGGWHLIGRTPLRLFDPARREPALLRPGDRVRFRPVVDG